MTDFLCHAVVQTSVCVYVHQNDQKSWPTCSCWLSRLSACSSLSPTVRGHGSEQFSVQWNWLYEWIMNRETSNKEHIDLCYLSPSTFYHVASEMSWQLHRTHREHSGIRSPEATGSTQSERKQANKVDAPAYLTTHCSAHTQVEKLLPLMEDIFTQARKANV